MILFSIIIPTYNRAAFVKKAIDSVLSQTYTAWELIVIDDASTDHTSEILDTYADNRISYYRNPINIERSVSRNKGIELAKGTYICFLDSDDYFLPHHLSLLAQTIEDCHNQVALFHSGVKQVNLSTHTEKVIERSLYKNRVEEVIDSHIPVISVAIHRSILSEFSFDPRLKINEDVHLFARIAARYPVIYNPEVTVVWVLHGRNTVNEGVDYITPQLVATQIIFRDKEVSKNVAVDRRRQKYYDLYSQLVYFHASHRNGALSFVYFAKAFLASPLNKNNMTNGLNVLYHLPGGRFIKEIVQFLKR